MLPRLGFWYREGYREASGIGRAITDGVMALLIGLALVKPVKKSPAQGSTVKKSPVFLVGRLWGIWQS